MNDDTRPVTHADLRALKKEIVEESVQELGYGQRRIERKLDITIGQVDDLKVRVGRLETKTA